MWCRSAPATCRTTPCSSAPGRSGKPVLLKRGPSAGLTDWLLSAEYVLSEGNPNVILCERGIRGSDSSTKNLFDLNAIPAVKSLSHLPIVADPSHGTGKRAMVPPMARAAVAAGRRRPAGGGARATRRGALRRGPEPLSRAVRAADGRAQGNCRGDRAADSMKRLGLIAALGLCAVAPLRPCASCAQDPLDIVRRASIAYRNLTSLQADFIQVIEDARLGDTLASAGHLYQAGQNKFAMRFTDPPDEAIVIDGKYSWFYTPSTAPRPGHSHGGGERPGVRAEPAGPGPGPPERSLRDDLDSRRHGGGQESVGGVDCAAGNQPEFFARGALAGSGGRPAPPHRAG